MKFSITIEKTGYRPMHVHYEIPDVRATELLPSADRERLMASTVRQDPVQQHEFHQRIGNRQRLVSMFADDFGRVLVQYLEENTFKPLPPEEQKPPQK